MRPERTAHCLIELFVAVVLIPLVHTVPTCAQTSLNEAAATARSKYDRGLRHFYWLYTFDPVGHQRRDWYQESAETWNETYEDGRYNHSLIVDSNAVVDGNTGIIAKAETSTLRLFIPDPGATGKNPDWLRIQQQGQSTWIYFAKKIEVEPSRELNTTNQVRALSVSDQASVVAASPKKEPPRPLSQFQALQPVAALTGDLNPIVLEADRASNQNALFTAIHAFANQKISLSKASKSAWNYKFFQKYCNDRSQVDLNYGPGHYCWELGIQVQKVTGADNPDVQAAFFRACALSNACKHLGDYFVDRKELSQALIVYTSNSCDEKWCDIEASKIYQSLGATLHLHETTEDSCHNHFVGDACNELRAQGEIIDERQWLADSRADRRERNREALRAERQRSVDYAQKQQDRADKYDAIAGIATSLAQTTADSYQQYQAGLAQARVNAAAIKMAQENKSRGAGGYPTTPSGGSSSTSGSSSASSTKSAPKKSGTTDTPDSNDSSTSSDSSADSSASGTASNFAKPSAENSQPSQSCQDMAYCARVISATYDANHFQHVVVKNTCSARIRITTSVYAQNRSCTVGQTSNFNPGDSQDLGAGTDRNWYQIQADDSVRNSVDGSGCRLVIPNSCN
jgi:hypothetical protein